MGKDQSGTARADWEQLGKALTDLKDKIGEEEGARVTLVQWARAGQLRTVATKATGFFGGSELNDDDWPIPVEFWQQLRPQEDFAWKTGNLELALEDSPRFDFRFHSNMSAPLLIGVRVNAEDMKSLLDSLPRTAILLTADSAPIRTEKNPPGPKADPDWDWAVYNVTIAVIAAGYSKQLKRGERAAIETQLLGKMAERNKEPSPDSARNYAKRVINALPDNSSS